jgi:putative ABC transport system substrate-binding protein
MVRVFTKTHFWLLLLGACLPAAPARAQADAPRERVILYVNEDNERVRAAIEKLKAALEKSGVAPRHRIRLHHVVVDFARTTETQDRIRRALALRPAAIIAPSGPIALSAKAVTRDVPIIFASYQNPIGLGLIDSLARPGGNVTGFTFFVPVDQKRLELLRQMLPKARRLGVLVDTWWMNEGSTRDFKAQALAHHGFEAEFFPAETVADLAKALASPRAAGLDAWYVPYTFLPFEEPAPVLRLFRETRKPVIFSTTAFVEQGGLMSYQQILTLDTAIGLWATMIGLVLDGVSPHEIPIERPKSFELAVNLDAAKRLGIMVPAPMLKRADRIFTATGDPAASASR